MTTSLMLLLALIPRPEPRPELALKPAIQYTLRVDSTDLSGWWVEIRLRAPSEKIRLAMAAHPEYDDKYWRYVREVTVEPSTAVIARVDSAVWEIAAPPGLITVRYRVALPPAAAVPRAAWQPFLTPTGGLIGGPHAFMYVLSAEDSAALVTLELPRSWAIATGLSATSDRRTFVAENAPALMDSPILAGRLREWRFEVRGVPHRVVYWPLPDATPFDTTAFVSGIRRMVEQAVALFGCTPYRDYTFQFQDGSFGGLEHHNSVTLGAPSRDLARDPYALLRETAHEFFHTWNMMAIRPVEYRAIDYRTQPPVSSLWFSEGLTLFYADLLLRRAGLPLRDSTRNAHLEQLMASYLGNPAYARFSAESISRVAYNAAPGALGDYGASTHVHGELLGTMLDWIVRDATQGRRSMDDVMRRLFESSPPDPLRERGNTGIDGRSVERAVEEVCACDVTPFFEARVRGAGAIDFDRYLALAGLRAQVAWGPAVRDGEPERDLRLFGWEPPGGGVQVIITNPTSIWARAGLHSRDPVISMDGASVTSWPEMRARMQRLRMGDTVRIVVERPGGPFEAIVVVSGFERPLVRLVPAPSVGSPRR